MPEIEIPRLTDPQEIALEQQPAVPTEILLTVDAACHWTDYILGVVGSTTVGATIEGLRSEGYSLKNIFYAGLDYLDHVRGNYILIDRGGLVHHDEPQGRDGEPQRVQRLRDSGVSDTDIYMAGVAKLAGPPETPEMLQLRSLLAANTTHDDIYLAGLRQLAGYPTDDDLDLG